MVLTTMVVLCMQCNRCGSSLGKDEAYDLHGKLLCEECYMYETNPPKACDPLAVASATSIRKEMGQSGIAGLSDLQKQIYRIIEQRRQITKEELLKIINVKPEELESQFAILRHCELVRAFKERDKVFLTIW